MNGKRIVALLTIAALTAWIGIARAFALDAARYAPYSVLSEGRWVKVRASGEGLNLVSTADLRAMGFSDPSKVNVYGTGGRMVREALASDMPDDLPLLPSARTQKGIYFFAYDTFTWTRRGDLYQHSNNPYCEESYYFLSDREVPERINVKVSTQAGGGGEARETFMARIVHEKDLQAPDEYGRLLLGEDFRTKREQSFQFQLRGRTSGRVMARTAFGARTTNGISTLMFKANGLQLGSSSSDIVPASSDHFIRHIVTEKEFDLASDDLSFEIKYSNTGALFTARLDYIEIFYPRAMRLDEGKLHFYNRYSAGETVEIHGCTESTVVWDLTAPAYPYEVKTEFDNGTLRFTVEATGDREFFAFIPGASAKNAVRVSNIQNQNIHAMSVPDMLIISPEEYMTGARKIASLHEEQDGMRVTLLTPEQIYNEFSGGHPDVLAFRKLLKMWYDRNEDRKISYCLIMGRGSYDSKYVSAEVRSLGYRPVPMWQSPVGETEVTAYSTDDIIGMLDDCTEDNFNMESATLHVAVGRLPVKNTEEAEEIASKIAKYATKPNFGSWRNRVMLIADDADNAIHLNQSESVYAILKDKAPDFRYERVYLDSYPLEYTAVGKSYPKAKEKILRLWNEGVAFTNYIGHGSPTGWTHEKVLEWKDFNSFKNGNLSFLYASTCGFGRWDGNNVSGAELILLNPKAGMIGLITASRTVYMGPNGVLNNYMAEYILSEGENGKGMRYGNIYINGKNRQRDENKLRYCLMADPALRFPRPEAHVAITKINDTEMDSDSVPELTALSRFRIEGSVNNPDGSVNTDFNGTLVLDLYDAERPVTTNGNGDTGVVSVYNDRKVRLSTVSTKVMDGKWKTTMTVPAEIDNNYSPARIVAYACDGNGFEAQGSTERLYVYGYAETGDEDIDGPEITAFYLNNRDFVSGDIVNQNPVAFAFFRDPSGINISESGVGHRMLLTLDGKEIYEDVASYYIPDPADETGGSIAYPISGLSAGRHSLELSVYDNANNVSRKEIEFNVAVSKDPVIIDLNVDRNPASTAAVFEIHIDIPNTNMKCLLDIYDLNGRKVWSTTAGVASDFNGRIQVDWNLIDASGSRVPRGIYLYRATVETPQGMYSSRTRKLAVTAR